MRFIRAAYGVKLCLDSTTEERLWNEDRMFRVDARAEARRANNGMPPASHGYRTRPRLTIEASDGSLLEDTAL